MKLSRLFHSLFACFTLSTIWLHGEIQNVAITWQSALCPPACAELLQKEFQKVRGVSQVLMNASAGQLQLKWQPNVPFSFAPINGTMRMVGPRLKIIRLTVRGHIRTSGNNITLVSDQDGTVFNLVNRITPVQDEYTEQYNIQTRAFPPPVVEEMRQKEKARQMVIIEGPLFQPERVVPLQLVVEYMKDAPVPATK
ncbi:MULTISPECIES: hypothetical protein [Parachlamydia]|jgi:hypothetical protein|uniref:Uncharacterized protein n=2 Tax=Parachlamydia acanthamoebae TaxID=83552 RepID=F8KW57_PARAV|nr:hypothetical protein [Parachlamydia acanthamoebae]EFB41350.1 hypothetical protein pah_c045o055 [Parachlamydia acanthamoebae str. Hall's coccus]CCB85609.1 putative uncharacterized protein [Parachlamydia acanthamoebae UV-7]